MAVTTDVFSEGSDKDALNEAERWIDNEAFSPAEARFLVRVMSVRITKWQADAALYVAGTAALFAIAAICAAVMVSDFAGDAFEVWRWITIVAFGVAGVGLVLTLFSTTRSDAWVTRLARLEARVLAEELDLISRPLWRRKVDALRKALRTARN